MPINFDALPSQKPNGYLIDPGFYKGTILKAEMRTPKSGGNPYLNVEYQLMRYDGTSAGKFWDMIFDIDKDLPRYKLAQFIKALKLPITGVFELRDLCKIIVGKSLIIDVGVDEKSDRPRNIVEVFKNEIFYPVEQWASLMGVQPAPTEGEFNAVDAEPDLPFDEDSDIY